MSVFWDLAPFSRPNINRRVNVNTALLIGQMMEALRPSKYGSLSTRLHDASQRENLTSVSCGVGRGGLVVSVIVIGPKFRGFKPCRGRWILKGDTNQSVA
jgi:hypothetical protein